MITPDTLVVLVRQNSSASRDLLPLLTALIGAVVGVVASIVAAFTARAVAGHQIDAQRDIAARQLTTQADIGNRQLRASVLAGNRIRWIEQLRNEITGFVAIAAAIATDIIGRVDEAVSNPKFDQLMRHAQMIALLTNPNETESKELDQAIENVEDYFNAVAAGQAKMANADVDPRLDRIRRAGRAILKKEWERVKSLE